MTSNSSSILTFVLVYKLTLKKRWYDCKTPIVSVSLTFPPFWSKGDLLQEKELQICLSGLVDDTSSWYCAWLIE